MAATDFNDLLRHVGHKIVCITYNTYDEKKTPVNVAIECENCQEVLLDYDKDNVSFN